jgi:hypothetical protein
MMVSVSFTAAKYLAMVAVSSVSLLCPGPAQLLGSIPAVSARNKTVFSTSPQPVRLPIRLSLSSEHVAEQIHRRKKKNAFALLLLLHEWILGAVVCRFRTVGLGSEFV